MGDGMTLNSYSEMKGYKCNTVQKVKKKEFVSLLQQSKVKRS